MTKFDIDKAQSKHIDVGHVIKSWATHLIRQRDELRRNPKREPQDLPFEVAVAQKNTGAAIVWETLGTLPMGLEGPLTVRGTSFEAARNRMTLHALLQQRLGRELVNKLLAAGKYTNDLEGRRAAVERVKDFSVYVAEMDLSGPRAS